MKRIYLLATLVLLSVGVAMAQKKAEIKFKETTHNFGAFSEENGLVTHVFVFTNTGDAPLVVHQAVASCGCTTPEYTKKPIMPGESGELKVTYDGRGRFPGYFKKSITVRSNAKTEMVRVYIEGDMQAKAKKMM